MCMDPIERMNARIEDLADEWMPLQKGVPPGSFRCPGCKEIRNYEPIQAYDAPDAPCCCYECLSPEMKAAWDRFENSCNTENTGNHGKVN